MSADTIHNFLSTLSEASQRKGPNDKIVMSSRVRLARNVRNLAFPGWAKKPERVKVLETIQPAIESLPQMKQHYAASMDQLSPLDKQILMERHLISREHAAKNAGSGLVFNKAESVCVMINEEDHLRMQALRPGFQIKEAWEEIDRVDSLLEGKLEYAFSPKLGYLTACPTNLGTGIRVSAMLHLPGLVLADQINQIIQAVSKLGLAVRGLHGEGTSADGNVFQVSNQMTLGQSESEIVERLTKVMFQIIEHEENARTKLMEEKPKVVLNQIGRAYGVLANAHSISSKETMNLLSLMRLGVDLALFPNLDRPLVDELFIMTQPGHLQSTVPEKLGADERDVLRSDILRERLSKVTRPVALPPTAGGSTAKDA